MVISSVIMTHKLAGVRTRVVSTNVVRLLQQDLSSRVDKVSFHCPLLLPEDNHVLPFLSIDKVSQSLQLVKGILLNTVIEHGGFGRRGTIKFRSTGEERAAVLGQLRNTVEGIAQQEGCLLAHTWRHSTMLEQFE